MAVSIGSSTQITVLVFPLMVLLGWAMDVPMDLNLHNFETICLLVTVFTVVVLVHVRLKSSTHAMSLQYWATAQICAQFLMRGLPAGHGCQRLHMLMVSCSWCSFSLQRYNHRAAAEQEAWK